MHHVFLILKMVIYLNTFQLILSISLRITNKEPIQ